MALHYGLKNLCNAQLSVPPVMLCCMGMMLNIVTLIWEEQATYGQCKHNLVTWLLKQAMVPGNLSSQLEILNVSTGQTYYEAGLGSMHGAISHRSTGQVSAEAML